VIDLYRLGRDQPDPLGVTATRLPDGNRLLAGVVLSQRLRLTRIYEEALSMAFLASLGLSLIIAIVQGRLIARQVSGIAETAEDVAVGALDRRVPINGSGDGKTVGLLSADSGVREMARRLGGLATAQPASDGPYKTLSDLGVRTERDGTLSVNTPTLNAALKADPQAVTQMLNPTVPSAINKPSGCPFHTRCPLATEVCKTTEPALTERPDGRLAACHHR